MTKVLVTNIKGPPGDPGPTGALNDLSDVDTTSASDGDFLSRVAGVWTPVDAPAGGTPTTLDALTDVDTTGAVTGDLLGLVDGLWVPVEAPAGGGGGGGGASGPFVDVNWLKVISFGVSGGGWPGGLMDGDRTSDAYNLMGSGTQTRTVDFLADIPVSTVNWLLYYGDGRAYTIRLEKSNDGTTWTDVYPSGSYTPVTDGAAGLDIPVNDDIRYLRFTSTGTNGEWIEVQVNGSLNLGTDVVGGSVLGDSDWTDATLAGTWTNYGTPYANAGFRKDAEGFIHLRGVVTGGVANNSAFTLPVEYRPDAAMLYGVPTGGASDVLSYVVVQADGQIVPGASTLVGLDGISFLAAGETGQITTGGGGGGGSDTTIDPWGPEIDYTAGAYSTLDGSIYRALVDNTNVEPSPIVHSYISDPTAANAADWQLNGGAVISGDDLYLMNNGGSNNQTAIYKPLVDLDGLDVIFVLSNADNAGSWSVGLLDPETTSDTSVGALGGVAGLEGFRITYANGDEGGGNYVRAYYNDVQLGDTLSTDVEWMSDTTFRLTVDANGDGSYTANFRRSGTSLGTRTFTPDFTQARFVLGCHSGWTNRTVRVSSVSTPAPGSWTRVLAATPVYDDAALVAELADHETRISDIEASAGVTTPVGIVATASDTFTTTAKTIVTPDGIEAGDYLIVFGGLSNGATLTSPGFDPLAGGGGSGNYYGQTTRVIGKMLTDTSDVVVTASEAEGGYIAVWVRGAISGPNLGTTKDGQGWGPPSGTVSIPAETLAEGGLRLVGFGMTADVGPDITWSSGFISQGRAARTNFSVEVAANITGGAGTATADRGMNYMGYTFLFDPLPPETLDTVLADHETRISTLEAGGGGSASPTVNGYLGGVKVDHTDQQTINLTSATLIDLHADLHKTVDIPEHGSIDVEYQGYSDVDGQPTLMALGLSIGGALVPDSDRMVMRDSLGQVYSVSWHLEGLPPGPAVISVLAKRAYGSNNCRVFYGGDYGALELHIRDGLPTSGGGSGATGSAPDMSPRSTIRTSGNITLNSTTYIDVDNALDLVIPAEVGDVIELSLGATWNDDGTEGIVNVATIVSNAIVNYVSSSDKGVSHWWGRGNFLMHAGAPIQYTVVSGDIEAGAVRFRLQAKTVGGAKILYAGTAFALRFMGKNLGQ